jgi:hypothetical protein
MSSKLVVSVKPVFPVDLVVEGIIVEVFYDILQPFLYQHQKSIVVPGTSKMKL